MAQGAPQGRDATYDIARGIGMMLVIYGHVLEPIFPARPDLGKDFVTLAFQQWQTIYTFHMPLFFLVSGAVNRNLTRKSWPDILRGSLRLLALAWIVHIIGAVCLIALGYAPDAKASVSAALLAIFSPIAQGSNWSIGVLWFLTSLCFVQIMAYALLRYVSPLWVVIGAMLVSAAAIYAPNYFLFKTWFPGLAFFVLGYLVAVAWQVKWPWWLCVPLLAAVIVLAPLNTGCSFSLDQTCYNVGRGFGVWMFAGLYGFLPLFYLTAILGSFAVLSLSAGLARFSWSGIFAYAGRYSLDLFIINGFVATLLPSYIAEAPWPHLTPLHYVALAIIVIGLHLAARVILRPVLKLIDDGAQAISGGIVGVVAGDKAVMT